MKMILLFCLTFVLFGSAFAQIEITASEKVYARNGSDIPDHKKTFVVRNPIVKVLASEKTNQKLNETIDYWKNFDTTLEENLSGYTWLDSFDYTVNYNKNGLLDIRLIMEGSGAYPDGQVKTLVIDVRTGQRLQINDVFSNIGGLVLKIDKAQRAEIRQAKLDSIRDGMDDIDTFDSLLGDKRFSVHKLDEFSISDEGVTFLYDYGFPHAFKALQPEGRYFFTWSELGQHIKRGGLLERFRV